MSKYPLHDLLHERIEEARTIGNFLDWLDEQDICLCVPSYDDEDGGYCFDYMSKEARIGAFLGIDPAKLEKEKRQMLDELRNV